ncbi:MAG: thiamine pyrophosphate-binding protein, partial [Acidimicrobiia bacterium]
MARNGVRRAVLAPGSRSGALALALATHPRIQLHVAIDERSAGFFALGSGKAGQPAVVVTTSGTAA